MQYRGKFKKQIVKEFEVVDGFPILDEYEHINLDKGGEDSHARVQPYKIDFRIPLKGISNKMISTTLLNVCNMFSTLYFMQLVVIIKSESINIPGRPFRRSDNGFRIIESPPLMLKFT